MMVLVVLAGMTRPLFPPISARALKHNEKNDTSKNPRPQIVGHT